jgi:hypothetical protein
MDTHRLTRTEVEDLGAWMLNGRQIKKHAGDDADLVHAEWETGDAGGGGEDYQCYVSAGGKAEEAERREVEREREDGVRKGMGGSPSLTDLEVDDVVDDIVELSGEF